MIIPFYNQDQNPIGAALAVNKRNEMPFTQIDVDHFINMCVSVSLLIQKTDLIKNCESEVYKTQMIKQMAHSFYNATSLEVLQSRCEYLATEILKVEGAILWLIDPHYHEIYRRVGNDMMKYVVTEGLCGKAAKTRKAIIENNLRVNKDYKKQTDCPNFIRSQTLKMYEAQGREFWELSYFKDIQQKNKKRKALGLSMSQKLLIMPLVYPEDEGKNTFTLPRGVLLLSQKNDGNDFTQEDARLVQLFCNVLVRFVDIIGVVEVFYGMRQTLQKLMNYSGDVETSLNQSSSHIDWIKKSLAKFERTINQLGKDLKNKRNMENE